MSTTTANPAEHVVAILRAHEAELRRAGIRRLSLFGSVVRDDAEADSDADFAAELDPAARIDLVRLVALERQLGELVGRPVDLLPEPVESRACALTSSGAGFVPSRHDPADSLADIIEMPNG